MGSRVACTGAFVVTSLAALAVNSHSQSYAGKHLENEKTEFMQRGASEPVDWYPLGPDALARARETNKPFLIEVGAIWCPFCSAMDRDSYGNPQLAKFINEHFVAVRVDYDARPELSHMLELARANASLASGLPLTLFVTPEGKLYDGGGYFPAVPAKHKPSFAEALRQAAEEFAKREFPRELLDIQSELKVGK